jgi:predicted nucleic acid-binding protein
MIILDTNVVSALMRDPSEAAVRGWLDRQPRSSVWTTAVTVMEIRFGLAVMAWGRQRERLERAFEDTLHQDLEGRIASLDASAAGATAMLMAERRRAGRVGELRDAMIAGTAIARHATLATRNTRHFADLRVPVVDPWVA